MSGLVEMNTIHVLLAAYVVCIGGLNLICFLISGFYQKKFGEYSPRIGFLIALLAGAALTILLLIDGQGRLRVIQVGQIVALVIAGAASVWNSASLYFTMKRIRK